MDRVPIPEHVYCPACAYHLYRLEGERCPECGYDVAGLRGAESGIPWVHRREIGWLRAFWATVWLVTFRNRKFCEEYARPVDYREARRFQFTLLAQVAIPLVGLIVACYFCFPPTHLPPSDAGGLVAWYFEPPTFLEIAYGNIWPAALLALASLLFVLVSTGVQSYFFHPRFLPINRQNAAIAMSYYSTGPLAMMGVVWALQTVEIVVAGLREDPTLLPWIYQEAAAVLLFVMTWINLVRTIRRIMPICRGRIIGVALLLPCLWVLFFILCLIVVPLVIVFPAVVWDSLR